MRRSFYFSINAMVTWPWWFVIGLIVLAALITIAYTIWIKSIAGYTEIQVPNGEVIPVAEVCVNPDADAIIPIGLIVLHRDNDMQVPWQLNERLSSKVTDMLAPNETKLLPLTVVKEPGYNSFRIYHKNKDTFLHAYKAWTNSVFHATLMPLEVLLRASLFPLWSMIDLVSHERRVSAAFIPYFSFDGNGVDRFLSELEKSISIVETYGSIYLHLSREGSFQFCPIGKGEENGPQSSEETLTTYLENRAKLLAMPSRPVIIPASQKRNTVDTGMRHYRAQY